MIARRNIVVLAPGGGHLERMLPLVAGLAGRGFAVHVMTRAAAREHVEAAGGTFIDVFAKYPVDAVDRESIPIPSRFVTFAAAYAEPLISEVASLRPALLVYDSFFVAAPLIARRLGVPHVGMRAGHAQIPALAKAAISRDPRVVTSQACLAAVARLRADHGMSDASPFSYLDGLSPFLNLYPEPRQFLDDEARAAFEPIAFFGSLAPDLRELQSRSRPLAGNDGRLRVYVAFGAVIWRYHAEVALSAMAVLAETFSKRDAVLLMSLGHFAPGGARRAALERPGARVEGFVDQWGALKDADLFVTHHGLSSTHEAIFHRVPMLSYPFLGDQPALARRCQDLGLAIALSGEPRAELEAEAVSRAADRIASDREGLAARLAEARAWERDVIESRQATLDRILALV